jgi:D-hexose-6-phosphate mutarotase
LVTKQAGSYNNNEEEEEGTKKTYWALHTYFRK